MHIIEDRRLAVRGGVHSDIVSKVNQSPLLYEVHYKEK